MIPLYYLCISRLKTSKNGVWWLFSYTLPFLILPIIYYSEFVFFQSLLFILAVLVTYEAGYVWNDFISSRKEVNTTVRTENLTLSIKEALFYSLSYVLLSVLAAYYFLSFDSVLIILAIFIAFIIHNEIRGRINILTILLLYTCKVTLISILIPPAYTFIYIFSSVFSYVIPRTLHYAAKSRFSFSILSGFENYRRLVVLFLNLIAFIGSFYAGLEFVFIFPLFIASIDLFLFYSKVNFKKGRE